MIYINLSCVWKAGIMCNKCLDIILTNSPDCYVCTYLLLIRNSDPQTISAIVRYDVYKKLLLKCIKQPQSTGKIADPVIN